MKDYKLNLLKRNNKIRQQRKQKITKQVHNILKSHNYLLNDEDIEKTTIATNFENITEAMNFFNKINNTHNLNIEYGDFTIINGGIFLTINPK